MNRKRWLVLLGIATIVLFVVLLVLERRIHHAGGPGIIGFELAATKAHANRILAEWGPQGRHAARLSLLIDYAYMLSYGAFFTLAGIATRDLARAREWRGLARAGIILPFFAAAAAVFDATENVFLLLVLDRRGGTLAPLVATICASIKFALIAIAIGYVLCGLVWRLLQAGQVRSATRDS